jgi:hypothetical protein
MMENVNTRRAVTSLCAILAAIGMLRTGHAAAPASIELAVPGTANAYPSVAASGQIVAVSWAASPDTATDVYTAVSRDGGRTFAKPVRVNDATSRANVSGEQPPRVAIVPSGGPARAIVVVWTAKGAAGTRLLSARSADGGATFGAAAPLPGSDAGGNRGWESIAVDQKGQVVALWLDHRDAASGGAAAGAMHHDGQAHTGHGDADGAARAQKSKLYFATLGGPSAVAITGGVCYCCKTSVAVGAAGAIYAAWRQVYPGNIRDIAFTWSRDGGRSFAAPVPVSDDRWALDGCPENGPALAVDARERVHVVWPTLVKDGAAGSAPNLALFYAVRSSERFSPRQAIPTNGTPRHPSLAAGAAGSLLVAWDEQAGGTRRVALASSAATGSAPMPFTRLASDTSMRGEYPVVAATTDGFVAAWTSGPAERSTIHLERIAAR